MKPLATEPPRTAPSVTDDPRWARLLARDRRADAPFWYSVATTRVYCRCGCPARAPHPDHVALYDTLEAARATGFRPCRRCVPDDPPAQATPAERVEKACRLIEQADEPPCLADLAAEAGCSPGHLHRLFKTATGLTPKQYAAGLRAGRVRKALTERRSVTEAIHEAGFQSSSRFYEQSTALLGMAPATYRAGGAREEIRFAVGACSLGAVLVASSRRGVVSILLGDDADALVRDLQDRFPNAHLLGADPAYESLIAAVVGFVEAPGVGLDLPLDLRGTVFQQRVWQALRDIPTGRTLSYAEVARRIGAPDAVRAVAGACAANHVALAVPCHRVVRRDGSVSGYAWGVERKQALLERESASVEGKPSE